MISNWSNLVARRDLLRELTLSELRSRSQETSLGWLFWLVDPLIMMLIYWAIVVGLFGRGQRYDPYPVFILCALLPFKHLASALTSSAKVLHAREALIKSIPFPTMALPITIVMANFSNFLFGMVVLIGAAVVWERPLNLALLQIPALMVCQLALVSGLCLVGASFGALVRDLSGFLTHILRVGFYLCPTLYGLDMVRERAASGALADGPIGPWIATLYALNPMVPIITGYRDAIFYGRFMEGWLWVSLAVSSLLLLWAGYWIYQIFDRRVIKFL
jgi:ABC-type polysaccharide/polyol phosphate export permease